MNSQPNAKSQRMRRWSPLTAVAFPALLLTALNPLAAAAGSPNKSNEPKLELRKAVNQIDGLTVEELDDGTTILRLLGHVEPTFNVYRLSKPDRLVVDVSKSERGKAVPHVPVDSWAVGRVTISSVEEHDSKLARIVVNLKRESSYIVVPKGRDLVVTITPREVAPEAYFARKSAGKRQAEIETMKAEAKKYEAAASARADNAERKADNAEDRATTAEQRAAAAEKRAREAAAKARVAERRASEIREAAELVKSKAEADAKQLHKAAAANARKLALAAEADAKSKRSSAEADARKVAREAEADARRLELAAKGKLSEATKLAAEYKAKLERAEQRSAEAERKAKHAELRAAEAKSEAATAESYAARVRASAEAKAKQAEELLAEAEDAMAKAQAESGAAKQEHERAKLALSDARKAARKLRRRDSKDRSELEEAVEAAEAATAAAKQREQQTTARLAKLQRDHEALAAALELKEDEASALEAELGTTRGALAEARESVREAKTKYESLGGAAGPSRRDRRAHRRAKSKLAKAETDLRKLRAEAETERDKLETLREQVASAGEQLGDTLAATEQRKTLAQEWDREREAAGVASVRDVRFEDGPKGARVVVELDGPVIYGASSLTPNMSMLELRDTRIPTSLERSLDTTSFNGPIDRITSFREGDDVKIVVASADGEPAAIELDRENNRLIWEFPKQARDETTRLASRGRSTQLEREREAQREAKHNAIDESPPIRSEVVSLAGNKVSGFATPGVLAARPGTQVGKRTRWRGERIDIELQDAPIKDVLLLFSDIGRVNIIAGPQVEGSVTMKLSSVPWDQALDIILRSLKLGMVQEGNVIRVATQAGLEEERRKAIEQANAQVQLKPLDTRLIPLSYATVQDMVPKVQSVLSSRGSVTPDSRTNTLIVMDVAENIALAESLVRQLDSQTPQVLIEARIVEARTNWLRQLGIQWGFDFIASPGTGNPTGLLFPNALGIAGGSGGNQSPVGGLILPGAAANPNYAVDLPAPVSTGTGGALGFSFGSLSGNLNTNLRLSAAEDEGEVRIISAPKIVTLDNTEAQIEQGVQIPISQVSAQGVNTRYVNATLGLRVTPHVTNEGAVMLEVEVQKNEADFVNTGARGDPTILTKSAQSQLLITDGDTAVIGGIYTRNQAVNRSKIPWFAEIPIIGWFFKNKTERDDRSEMLIFLTPRIVNRSTSIGG